MRAAAASVSSIADLRGARDPTAAAVADRAASAATTDACCTKRASEADTIARVMATNAAGRSRWGYERGAAWLKTNCECGCRGWLSVHHQDATRWCATRRGAAQRAPLNSPPPAPTADRHQRRAPALTLPREHSERRTARAGSALRTPPRACGLRCARQARSFTGVAPAPTPGLPCPPLLLDAAGRRRSSVERSRRAAVRRTRHCAQSGGLSAGRWPRPHDSLSGGGRCGAAVQRPWAWRAQQPAGMAAGRRPPLKAHVLRSHRQP